VGTNTATSLGLYDRSGNVWEWCEDYWDDIYNGGLTSAQTNPHGPTWGTHRVMRGGSWNTDYSTCRVANRDKGLEGAHFDFAVGFRLVLDPISELEGNMVSIPAASYTLGGTYSGYNAGGTAHTVNLSAYKIGKYEVTQAQWQAVMNQGSGGWPGTAPSTTYGIGPDVPLYNVSWDKAKEFIDALNLRTGLNYRLPTEAEWEWAARGGAVGNAHAYAYSGSPTLEHVAWYSTNSGKAQRVGTIADALRNEYHTWLSAEERVAPHPLVTNGANELGLYDMSGNVYEWCSDYYTAYVAGTVTNPNIQPNPQASVNRVMRGGYFAEGAGSTQRVNFRTGSAQTTSNQSTGFRLVISP
jgi:formylglycine-generating enzyme required for sulfatase activity